jgi:hypothetical protein
MEGAATVSRLDIVEALSYRRIALARPSQAPQTLVNLALRTFLAKRAAVLL